MTTRNHPPTIRDGVAVGLICAAGIIVTLAAVMLIMSVVPGWAIISITAASVLTGAAWATTAGTPPPPRPMRTGWHRSDGFTLFGDDDAS